MKHKRFLSLFLAVLLLLSAGCSGEPGSSETTTEPTEEILHIPDIDDGITKILCIGNSFTVDTLEYVHKIAQSAGVKDFILCKAVFPGASIDNHALYASMEDRGRYELAFNTADGGWEFTLDRCLWEALEAENWDYVVIQQNSPNSGNPQSFGQLDYLMKYLTEHIHPDAQVVYNMTWAYQKGCTHYAFADYQKDQLVMYEAILSTIQSVILSRDDIKKVIPTGTAIQNARTSHIGDNMTLPDGYHLNHQAGRYIAAMAFAAYMLEVDPDLVTYMPEGVTEPQRQAAAEAAKNALAHPFEVTQSSFTQAP